MAWSTSTRRMPPDWHRQRGRIRKRDGHQCTEQINGQRCPEPGDHVDHIMPASQGGTEDDTNLRTLCAWHHGQKSSREGAAAAAAKRAQARRPTEPHPGLI